MKELKFLKERQKDIFYSGYYKIHSDEIVKPEIKAVPFENSEYYYYPDVDYCGDDRALWQPSIHLVRLHRQLALAGKEKLHNEDFFRISAIKTLNFWLEKDFKNPGWWYNQIGIPKLLADIAIALEDYLTEEAKETLKKIISRGIVNPCGELCIIDGIDGYSHKKKESDFTGANLIWRAAITIKYALLFEDEAILRIALEKIASEMCYSYEGVQKDGAFCQHGRLWYSGGYGRSFVYELAPILNIVGGTRFAFSSERLEPLFCHILCGQRLMMKNGYFDFGSVGREYVREDAISFGELKDSINLICADMADFANISKEL